MQKQNVEQVIGSVAERFLQAGLNYGHGTDNAWDEAAWVVHFALGLDYSDDPIQYQQILSGVEHKKIQTLANKRISTRKPLAYLTRQMWFAGIEFYVDERVLVPRSPIAELIQSHFHPWIDGAKIRTVLDLCTGSACIGLAIALHMPQVEVTCTDISDEALQVAKENRERLNLQSRVDLIKSDLLNDLSKKKFDLIVSNPPYVDKEDMQALPIEFTHEPELGLASGLDGLSHTQRILQDARDYLTKDGHIIVEVGNSMQALQDAYPQVPFMCLEFEYGGEGVFMLSAEQLRENFA